jgi:hypothetical protein
MYKLGSLVGDDWREHSHPPIYEEIENGPVPRILATAPGGDPLVIERLTRCLRPPFLLLYILHTPRGEGRPGRYQSPEISGEDFQAFLRRFGDYLRADARFDLWVHSPADQATIVWDRHNLVHGYGPVTAMVETLRGLGFRPGKPAIPSPHGHRYHPGLDSDARDLLAYRDWTRTPLQPEDEQ